MIGNKRVRSSILVKEILKRGYYVRIPTLGRSMFPLISSIIHIEPAKAEDIRVGDIVVYSSEEKMVAHRLAKKIIKEEKELLVVKGDTWLGSSEVLPKDVIGKVIKVEKWGIQLNFKGGIGKIFDIICRSTSPLTSRLYSILKNGKHWLVSKNEKSI
jgi:signal peptidase I